MALEVLAQVQSDRLDGQLFDVPRLHLDDEGLAGPGQAGRLHPQYGLLHLAKAGRCPGVAEGL